MTRTFLSVMLLLALGLLAGVNSADAHKLGLHGIYMEPNGSDAEEYSDGAVGYGVHFVGAGKKPFNMFGFVIGLENVDLHSDTERLIEPTTLLRVDHKIRQRYTRFFVGAELGGHGRGFLRPHIGMNLAIINYGFSIDAEVKDDYDPDLVIRQEIYGEDKWVFGQDITLGLDLLVHSRVYVDVGVRYLKSYSVPVPLEYGPVEVHPEYFQVYLGIGLNFDAKDFAK
ncbi:hypothetical protein KKC97_11400 [bacterium]|nr:hypothetical protein [bacterium]MBU1638260.1 hypothetical protein [bacterium]MBU1919799.1 hypothetical protein [bacterium]